MKISVDFSRLRELAQKMGNFPSVALPEPEIVFEPIDTELERGAVLDPSKYSTTGGILPTYEGRQVVLYIKDHSYQKGPLSQFDRALQNASAANKVHVAQCKTLDSMAAQGRYDRYVACNKITGMFEISGPRNQTAEVALHVCKNCLSLLNYKAARDSTAIRNNLAENFDFNDFFKTYSSFFDRMPRGMATDEVGYTDDWLQISRSYREKAGYVCSDCRVDLKQHKNLCHVHHINSVKNDNSPNNLEVLCADCHRKRHGTHLYLSHEDTQTINRLRKEQGLMRGGWEEALELADPAVHGELLLLQKQGYAPPEIGYEIVGDDGAVIAELEAAWHARKECLVVDSGFDETILRGWKVWHFGEVAKQQMG